MARARPHPLLGGPVEARKALANEGEQGPTAAHDLKSKSTLASIYILSPVPKKMR
jgi:hypothetical protein